MTLSFQQNADGFAESELLILRGLPGRSKGASIVLTLCIISFFISGMFWQWLAHIPRLSWQVLFTAGLLTFVLVFGARFIEGWVARWLFRRQYRVLTDLHLPIQIATNEHEMVYTNARYKRRASWASIVRWRETKASFLIYIKFSLFVLIPKRDMPPGQVSAFRELLSSKLPGSHRGPSVLL